MASKYFSFGGTVEDRGDCLEAKDLRGPAQGAVRAADRRSSAGHAQWVQQDVDRVFRLPGTACPLRERFGRYDALVAVAAGHLVTDGDLSLVGQVDLDHFKDAAEGSSSPRFMWASFRSFSSSSALIRGQNWPQDRRACLLRASLEPLIHFSLKFSICSRMTSGMSEAPTFCRVEGSTISVPRLLVDCNDHLAEEGRSCGRSSLPRSPHVVLETGLLLIVRLRCMRRLK